MPNLPSPRMPNMTGIPNAQTGRYLVLTRKFENLGLFLEVDPVGQVNKWTGQPTAEFRIFFPGSKVFPLFVTSSAHGLDAFIAGWLAAKQQIADQSQAEQGPDEDDDDSRGNRVTGNRRVPGGGR